MGENFGEEIESELAKSGESAGARGLELKKEGKFSKFSWIYRDKESGKDIIFKLTLDDRTDKIVERQWIEKDGNGERTILYEKPEEIKKITRDKGELVEVEKNLMGASKRFIN